jgi:DNA-binding MarR family transcriptional regulator
MSTAAVDRAQDRRPAPGRRVETATETETATALAVPTSWVDVVDQLLGVATLLTAKLARVAAEHELTPQQALLLRSLDEPRRMSALALDRSCDPSNITGMIDRLERRELVERRPDPVDRRARLLALTEAGRRLRDAVEAALRAATADLCHLDGEQVAALAELLGGIGTGVGSACQAAEHLAGVGEATGRTEG